MANTTKNFIFTDSPQYKEHIATIKVQILQNFSKYMTFKHIFADHFSDNPGSS